MFRLKPVKLHDCHEHGAGSELFIVEGDSASKSVCRARRVHCQAVLPMQGKPMNAYKASKAAVGRNELYQALINSIGAGWGDDFKVDDARYERVILLFDPDADGIHCGALMSMFFYRWMRPLMEAGRVGVIRPPLYEISSPTSDDKLHAYTDSQYRKLREELDSKEIEFTGQRYRGLASMNDMALFTTCIDPETRNLNRLELDDAEAAIRVFVGDV